MRPRTLIEPCICGRHPEPKFKHIFSNKVRLDCECGVAGQWRDYRGRGDPWHAARSGWDAVFPVKPRPPARPKR